MADYDIFHFYSILDHDHRLDEGKYSLSKYNVYNLQTRTFCFIRIPKTLRVVTRKKYLLALLKLKESKASHVHQRLLLTLRIACAPFVCWEFWGHVEVLWLPSIVQYKTIKNLIFLSYSQQLNLSEKESETQHGEN